MPVNGNEKCDSHNDCFRRLFAKIEEIDKKQEERNERLCNLLHAGEIRFTQIEMRLVRCEEQMRTSNSGRIDIKRKLTGSVIDLIKMAIVGICGAALWAVANGYGG